MSPPVPTSHPRYRSLMTREKLVEAARGGLVAWEGLIAHGRGEAFDYLLGERTLPEAYVAERAAVAHLLLAERPVLSVNGNVAVLAGEAIRDLAEVTGARVEINVFHRTEERVRALAEFLRRRGIREVLGEDPDAELPGLEHPRALCTKRGIYQADVVLVPLEDGDRAEALVRMKKVVVSVDLNPLSRTSRTASVAVVDELGRALPNMVAFARENRDHPAHLEKARNAYRKEENLGGVLRGIRQNLGASGPADPA